MCMVSETTFIEDEINRLEAGTVQSEQSIMVQLDMKQWAVENEMWPSSHYANIIDSHAEARGWTQEGFTGMEIWG